MHAKTTIYEICFTESMLVFWFQVYLTWWANTTPAPTPISRWPMTQTRHFFQHHLGGWQGTSPPRHRFFSYSFEFCSWVLWKIFNNAIKSATPLKILSFEEKLSGISVFFSTLAYERESPPKGWVFCLSFLLEFCLWVLVFSAGGVIKKAWCND